MPRRESVVKTVAPRIFGGSRATKSSFFFPFSLSFFLKKKNNFGKIRRLTDLWQTSDTWCHEPDSPFEASLAIWLSASGWNSKHPFQESDGPVIALGTIRASLQLTACQLSIEPSAVRPAPPSPCTYDGHACGWAAAAAAARGGERAVGSPSISI